MPHITVADVDIHYEVRGSGSPVVLVHGLGSCGADWEAQAAALAPSHRVITLDLRGHGQSSRPPGPYVMTDFSREVAALIDELGAAPAHLVGISLGGMIAFQLAVDAPHEVRSLVIVNSGPEVVPRTLSDHLFVWSRLTMTNLFPMTKMARSIGKRLFPKEEQRDLRDAFIERMSKNDKPAYQAALRAIPGWSVLDRVADLEHPTLVVTGDRDYTPVEAKEKYAARMKDARVVVVKDSGHATPLDQPAELNRLLVGFLASVDADARVREVA